MKQLESLDQLVRFALKYRASDFHLAGASSPWLRIRGNLIDSEFLAPAPAQLERWLDPLLTPQQKLCLAQTGHLTLGHSLPEEGFCRLTVVRQRGGLLLSGRLHDWHPPQLPDLGLRPEQLATDHSTLGRGLWVFGGVGRTTLVSAVVDRLAASSQRPIWLLGPCRERGYPGRATVQHPEQIPQHFPEDSLIVCDDLLTPAHVRWIERWIRQGLDVIVTHPGFRWEDLVHEFADRFWGTDDYPSPRFENLFERLGGFVYQRLVLTRDRESLVGCHELFLRGKSSMIDEIYYLRRAEGYMQVPPHQTFEIGLVELVFSGKLGQTEALLFAEQHDLDQDQMSRIFRITAEKRR